MNHSLVNEIRALAQNLEHWENLISESSATANLDSVKRWKIGLEADIADSLQSISDQFKVLERVRKPRRGRPKGSTNKTTRVTRTRK